MRLKPLAGEAPGGGRGATAIGRAAAGLRQLGSWYGGNARKALRFGRFLLSCTLIPQAILCCIVLVAVVMMSLSLPTALRIVYSIAAGLCCFGALKYSLRMVRLAGRQFPEEMRELLRESPELSGQVMGALRQQWPRYFGAQQAAPEQQLSLPLFLQMLRFAAKAVATVGQLALPRPLDLASPQFLRPFAGLLICAWLPLPLSWLIGGPLAESAGAGERALRFAVPLLSSMLLSLPPLSMLVALLVTRRAAAYIGIAEAILDAGVAVDKQLKKPEHRL